MRSLTVPAKRLAVCCTLLSVTYLLIFAYFTDHTALARQKDLFTELLRSVYIAAVLATAGTLLLDLGICRTDEKK